MGNRPSVPPVRVASSIPVAGEHAFPAELARTEGIPTPEHLCVAVELGRGSMGHVHFASDRNLLRQVALKRLDKEYTTNPVYRKGFIAEAQITGQLEHPNIVPVHELAVDEHGVPFFTMKLVQGQSFAAWLADPIHVVGSTERLERGLDVLLKVCDAVAYAHHRGVIHRDLKPDNIMVADFGQVYLMDWGVALLRGHPVQPADERRALENSGPVGTPAYMSPEQARGNPHEMDERTDVFGLGAMLYELVTSKLPYGNPAPARVIMLRAHMGAVVPVDVAAPGGGVPRRLHMIIERAIDPDPAKRYPSVVELQRDLRAFVRGGLHLPRRQFAPGDIIMREGDVGDAAYMIVSGRCHAFRNVGPERETLAVMQTGEVFGEMSLLLDEPRAASVEALDPVTLLVLDQHTLTEGLSADGWTGALVRALAQRFRDLEHQFRNAGLRRGTQPPPVPSRPR
ncbi:MAG TPA: protein kinase [Polyangiales bacterium]|nr:protein kinase [Polyangiales bacterium]